MKKNIYLFIGLVIVVTFFNVAFLFAQEAEENINIPPEMEQLMEKLQKNNNLTDEEWEKLAEMGKESYEASGLPKTEDMKQFEKSSTLSMLDIIKASINLYYLQNGALPGSLEELNNKEKSMMPLGDNLLKDMWKEPLQYSIEQDYYVIWSKGADKISGTEDDISIKSGSKSKDIVSDMANSARTSSQNMISLNRLQQLEKEGKSTEEIEQILKEEQGSLPLSREIVELLNIRKQTQNRSNEARIAAAKADVKANIATSLKLYELDNNTFPNTEDGLEALVKNPNSAKSWQGPYLQKIPKDPWGNKYIYISPSDNKKGYELFSCGPDGIKNTEDDI